MIVSKPNYKAILDLETLDTKPSAVVLSVGFLIYDENKQQSFDELLLDGHQIVLDIQPQLNKGRTISKSTLQFWMEQDNEARNGLFYGEEIVSDIPQLFNFVIKNFKQVYECKLDLKNLPIQCRGQDFDIPMIRDLMEQFDLNFPFPHWKSRDLRTIYEENNFKYKQFEDNHKPSEFIKHNALHDCAMDAFMLQRMRANNKGT